MLESEQAIKNVHPDFELLRKLHPSVVAVTAPGGTSILPLAISRRATAFPKMPSLAQSIQHWRLIGQNAWANLTCMPSSYLNVVVSFGVKWQEIV